ncbi:cysteine-rich motor neuron 1 protein-like isoform X2 [Macrosteles quadrilineatus]|uniref:cysteine-rich motor neuron 1 protein-like isoform X2 n=1 Tax=Macrosteles quadrilineatus TaxID=74068 RepID=UPI0023E1DB78|nr:cysteine-rich motor neuron 1 protein-like isoform X2 [Macrosteles quadrilineatus]
MASAPGFDVCVWMLLLVAVPGIQSGDNNTSDNEVLCPPDSTLDGQCICDSSRCPHPTVCDAPQVLERTVASGLPGDCCDKYECVSPRATNSTDTDDMVCPEDSYRLRSVGCQCLPAPCLVKVCPSGTWAKIVRPGTGKPGACCPLYECVTADSNSTCIDNGTLMQNGSSWFRPDCTQCRCEGGLTFCVPVGRMPQNSSICRPLPPDCTLSTVPAGECCPVCVSNPDDLDTPPPPGSCVARLYGKIIPNGGSWQEDDCTSCVCKDGQRQCQAYMCEACANPQYEPGECCPRCNGSVIVTVPSHCPSLDNCSLRCVHGFVRDINGCFTCHCQQDECLLECEHGYAQDSHGNKLCKCAEPKCPPLTCRKVCPHGYRINKAGCEICRCETCKPLDQCTKRCAHGLMVNSNNCIMCKCIPHGGLIGGISNTTDTTVGTPCISDSKVWRDDGETWFDGCRQCYCLSGREMCSLLSCPPISCTNPVYNSSKDCCPTCQGTDLVPVTHMVCQGETPGKLYKEGETWRLSPCVECVCQSGRALCHAASCPPTPCRRPLHPPPGECCPVCAAEQLANFSLATSCDRRQGESMWREGNCVSCLCDSGRPSCFTELCEHQGPCNNALQVKNQCCPICLEELDSKMCTVNNTAYLVGQDWREDECTTCECIAGGEISCTKLVCSVNCPNPVKKPGVCCHVCPENKLFWTSREVVYIVVLALVACFFVCLAVYIARQCRLKRHQLKLPNSYGCPPPQYTQYKYMPTYDTPQPPLTSEKTALTPL